MGGSGGNTTGLLSGGIIGVGTGDGGSTRGTAASEWTGAWTLNELIPGDKLPKTGDVPGIICGVIGGVIKISCPAG